MLDTRLAAFCKGSLLPETTLLHPGMAPAAKLVHSREWATFSCTDVVAARPPRRRGCTRRGVEWELNETLIGMNDQDGEVEHLGRWRDPKDAVRRAVRPIHFPIRQA